MELFICSSLHLKAAGLLGAGGRRGPCRSRLALCGGRPPFSLAIEEVVLPRRFHQTIRGQRVVRWERPYQPRRDDEHKLGLLLLELRAAEQCTEDWDVA